MKMNVTEKGIDWDRIPTDSFDDVYAFAMEAGEMHLNTWTVAGEGDEDEPVIHTGNCTSQGHYEETEAHARNNHFTSIGGTVFCKAAALRALVVAGDSRYGGTPEQKTVYHALNQPLGSARKAAFAEHVRTA